MKDHDVMWVVEIFGQDRDVQPTQPVSAEDGLIFEVSPENPVLQNRHRVSANLPLGLRKLVCCSVLGHWVGLDCLHCSLLNGGGQQVTRGLLQTPGFATQRVVGITLSASADSPRMAAGAGQSAPWGWAPSPWPESAMQGCKLHSSLANAPRSISRQRSGQGSGLPGLSPAFSCWS